MADERTDVIVATGGTRVVRAAYSLGQPGDRRRARQRAGARRRHRRPRARRRAASSTRKAFDNSLLCTNESALIAEERRRRRARARARPRAARTLLDAEASATVRATCLPRRPLRPRPGRQGRAAIAARAGIRVRAAHAGAGRAVRAGRARGAAGAREALARCSACVRVPDARRGIDAARALLRIGGAGHSAAIHCNDPRTIIAYGAAVQVLRVAVNAGGSTGSAGFETNLAPSMTIGTGFFGRSSLGGEPAAAAPRATGRGCVRQRIRRDAVRRRSRGSSRGAPSPSVVAEDRARRTERPGRRDARRDPAPRRSRSCES